MTEALHRRLAKLKGSPCKSPGCRGTSVRLGSYCKPHARVLAEWGHPKAYPIDFRKDLLSETALVREFLPKHTTHPGIIAGLCWLGQLLKVPPVLPPGVSPVQGLPPIPLRTPTLHIGNARAKNLTLPEMLEADRARMVAGGMTPNVALEKLLTVWLFSEVKDHRLPDDQRLTYALANVLLTSAPKASELRWTKGMGTHRRYARIGTIPRRELGQLLRKHLCVLLMNASRAIVDSEATKERFTESMHTPFTTT